jgi:carbonic anhydrase/acetyltransferase-like protein (isoleucine patch superfamily)
MILSYKGIYPKIHKSVFICEGVQIIGDVEIGKDSSVWFNTVIRGDVHYIRIGEKTNIQDNCTLHVTWKKFPLEIGNRVTVGHGVTIHGCTLKDNIIVGMGAVLLDGCLVNSNSFIAAGTLVREKFIVPEGVLVAGMPGKVIRELKPEEIRKIRVSSDNYLGYVKNYRNKK